MTGIRLVKYVAPALIAALAATPAFADAVSDSLASAGAKGDTAWMLTASALVLLMTVPGLALFYGGLVRSKNMLSVFTQVFAIAAIVSVIWVVYGYSLTFTEGSGALQPFFGGFSKLFLQGVTTSTGAATFSNGVYIPEYVYICFQMTFAMITPGLIVGAFAERIKFSALIVFIVLWVTFIYFPIAQMVWYWGGPDAASAPSGLLYGWGALDFAGGTVVHINAGIAGLVGAFVLGKRVGYGKEQFTPHSLTLTMVGASMLWVGWFGFNAGSALEANGFAALAFINTLAATAAAVLAWCVGEALLKGKASMLGAASGAVAGLVAITPAAGNVGIGGGLVIGIVAGFACLWGVSGLKKLLGADDSLDVFGVHGVGGIVGALLTGVFASPNLGGPSAMGDWVTATMITPDAFSIGAQFLVQAKAVGVTLVWSGVVSVIAYKLVDLTIGLRVTEEEEREGLDISSHGETAYHK